MTGFYRELEGIAGTGRTVIASFDADDSEARRRIVLTWLIARTIYGELSGCEGGTVFAIGDAVDIFVLQRTSPGGWASLEE